MDLTGADLKPLHACFEDDVTAVWDFQSSVDSRDAPGGTGRESVRKQIADFKAWLDAYTRTSAEDTARNAVLEAREVPRSRL